MRLSFRQWAGLAAALFLLNAALSFHNVWPTLWIELWPELSVEAAAIVLALGLWQRFRGPVSRTFLAVVTALVFVMTIGRYLEVTAPALYGRAINLYWDARYIPDVAAMFAARASPLAISGLALAFVAGVVLLAALIYRVLATIAAALTVARPARILLPLAAVLIAAYFAGYYGSAPTLRWFSIPVSRTYARQVRIVTDALAGTAAELPDTQPLAGIDPALAGGHDVLLTFIESYGAVAFDDPELSARLEEPRQRFAAAIGQSHRRVVSAWLRAPTTGGGSWLSHISVMSGLWIDDPARYQALLTEARTTLPKAFAAAGYRTLAWMPGLKNEWPEGRFYGFDAIDGTNALAYAGPAFGWWEIPDQYALAKLDATALAPADRPPVFVFFPTISTHAPFGPTPPYQPDWHRMLSTAPYDTAELAGLDAPVPALDELKTAYGNSVAYTYDYWGGYLKQTADRDRLVILLGDHQPPATVAGPGARLDVPVHVITRDDALVERLLAHGFVTGLTPADGAIGRLNELGPMLFD